MKKINYFFILTLLATSLSFAQTAETEPNDSENDAMSSNNYIITNGDYTGAVTRFDIFGGGGTDDFDKWLFPFGSSGTLTINVTGDIGLIIYKRSDGYNQGTYLGQSTQINEGNSPQTYEISANEYNHISIESHGFDGIPENYTFTISNGQNLPVELTTFTSDLVDNTVELNWQTATEVNNYGFEVQRSVVSSQNSEDTLSGVEEWETIGFVQGNGTTNSPKQYSFTDLLDLNLNPNLTRLDYRLKQIDNDGTFAYSKTITVDLTTITSIDDEEVPTVYSLEQNYPNPFNPSTKIRFSIASGAKQSVYTTLKIYNMLGQEVRTLVNQKMQAGYHEVNFDASQLTSGMYIYRLTSGSFTQTKKMILLK